MPQLEGHLLKFAEANDVRESSEQPLSPKARTAKPLPLPQGGDKWVKRWFVLRGNKLLYYKNQNDPLYMSFIPLYAAISVSQVLEPTEIPNLVGNEVTQDLIAQCTVRIVTPGRTFYLIAETKGEAREWAELLSAWRDFFSDDGRCRDYGGMDECADDAIDPQNFIKGSLCATTKEGRPVGRAPWPSGLYSDFDFKAEAAREAAATNGQSVAIQPSPSASASSPAAVANGHPHPDDLNTHGMHDDKGKEKENETRSDTDDKGKERREDENGKGKDEKDEKGKGKEAGATSPPPVRGRGMIGHRGTISAQDQARILAARAQWQPGDKVI